MSDIEPVGGLIRSARRRRQQRRWTAEVFPTSAGGTLRVPYPSGVASPPVTGGEALFGSAPIGEILRVAIHNEHHGPGEPLVFDTILEQNGFPDVNLPGVEIELPHTAVYGIEGDFSYTGGLDHTPFVGGGDVYLLLNGVGIPGLAPIRAGGLPDRRLGKTFSLAQEFVAQKGDILSIVLDWEDRFASGSEPDIEGVIEVATKEPLRVLVTPPAQELPAVQLGQTFIIDADGPRDAAIAVEFQPAWQAGDLVVTHVNMCSTEAVLVSLSDIPGGLGNLSDGWSFLGSPVVVDNPGVNGQVVAFAMWKILEPSDESVIQVTRAVGMQVWERTPSTQGVVETRAVSCPYPGAGGVQLIDLKASTPASPWNATLSASGSGLLTSVVVANRYLGGAATGPDDAEVAVDEWDTWLFHQSSSSIGITLRAQTAQAPQSPRTVSITTGNPAPQSGVSASVWAVT